MSEYTKEELEAEGLTHGDFMTAFDVIERARECARKEGIEPEWETFNNAHAFLQEYQERVAKAEYENSDGE